jgi:hypothetical protein
MEATRHPPDSPEPSTPAAVAYGIRDHLATLGNALELARRAAAGNPALTASLDLIARQAAAIARLTDELDNSDPAATRERAGPG